MQSESTGIILMLALGLRHGIDPDHIAVIDGLTLHHHHQKSVLSKWVGTLFAIGHGLTVTMVSVLFSLIDKTALSNEWFLLFFEWIPVILLYWVGLVNLRNLYSVKDYKIQGWRTKFIPRSLLKSNSVFAIILTGLFFATVFDTVTQAAAWGYMATQNGGAAHALLMGIVFSVGMIATDTVDGRMVHSILNKANSPSVIMSYRKWMGICIVAMSLFMAIYKTLVNLNPQFCLSEFTSLLIGILFFLSLSGIYTIFALKNYYSKSI